MPFQPTPINDLLIFEPRIFNDNRGYFFESYNQAIFSNDHQHFNFVQDNQSFSCYGVIRGLHYQTGEYAQTKLVRVLQGAILDVVVDLRQHSPSFKKVYAIELSAANKLQLLVPKGFAHGFSVLSETAEILYKCDNFYNKSSEAGIIYNATELAIDWQIPSQKALVSDKDMQLPQLKEAVLF